MHVYHAPVLIRNRLKVLKQKGYTLGFVPTMGALHEGHLSLIQRARKENDIVVVSIFVNPLQFGPHEDFKKYPRTLQDDIPWCRQEGVDFLFVPSVQDMYPSPTRGKGKIWTSIDQDHFPHRLCGLRRLGHFRGVLTVVAKLFHIVLPHRSYFGQKDYQQAVIIRQMVKDLNFDVQVKICPTVREADGLAMSSRNAYLSPCERREVPALYRALQEAKKTILRVSPTTPTQIIRQQIRRSLTHHISHVKIDYIELVHPDTLDTLPRLQRPLVMALACWVGQTRLIDNLLVS